MIRIHVGGAALAALLSACAGSPDPAREDLTAAGHEAEAEEEEREAAGHEAEYEPSVRTAGGQGVTSALFGIDTYNPTESHLAAAAEHREHAEAHRSRAAALRTFEEAECGHFPPETRAACPLLLGIERVEDIPGGARMVFAEDADIAPIVEHIRCHLAFAAAQGSEGMDECALYVHGAQLDVQGGNISLTTSDRRQVAQLRLRVRAQAP